MAHYGPLVKGRPFQCKSQQFPKVASPPKTPLLSLAVGFVREAEFLVVALVFGKLLRLEMFERVLLLFITIILDEDCAEVRVWSGARCGGTWCRDWRIMRKYLYGDCGTFANQVRIKINTRAS